MWFKWISSLTISWLGLVGASNVSAVGYDVTHTLGQAHTFNPIIKGTNEYAGPFTDKSTFELSDTGSASISIMDIGVGSTYVDLLNISDFTIFDGASNNLFSTGSRGDLLNTTFILSGLAAGLYSLHFIDDASGAIGSLNDVTVSAVPLPAAAWLFGSALIGFVAFSARRSL